MNPVGILILAIGILLVIIGIHGTQHGIVSAITNQAPKPT